MEDLLGHFLGGDAGAVLDEIEPVYGIIPDDPSELDVGELVGSTFSRMSQSVGELHIRGYFDVAQTAANEIVQDDTRRTRMFGDCVQRNHQLGWAGYGHAMTLNSGRHPSRLQADANNKIPKVTSG